MTNKKAEDLSRIERNIENLESQKRRFEQDLAEVAAAINQLDSSGKAYKIIGNLMILKDSSELKKELAEKEETLKVRINSLDKQLDRLKTKAGDLREELLKDLSVNKQ